MPYSLFLLLRDPLVSWKARLKAGLILAAVAFYILDPMDIVPDFIPFTGWLDDLVIVPAVLAAAGKIVPEVNLAGITHKARSATRRMMLWTLVSIIGLIVTSLSMLGLLIFLIIKALS
jgi:uncharacterized membrane protein YkvA (DUF1232 family)